jgi:RNA polymerase-interacting CarD/CdnL/TRCF family regulator
MKVGVNDTVVIPLHGVGIVIRVVEDATVGGLVAEIQTRAYLDIKPLAKMKRDGYRFLATQTEVTRALAELCKVRRKIPGWGWQQQKKYLEKKQQSSNIVDLAECIRDLYVHDGEERSYARMIIYEQILERFADEVALVLGVPRLGMRGRIESTIIDRKIPLELHTQVTVT